ncbi:MAG TPA: type II toxin-antitoxin system VapC family toxin [Thauera sp.]|uniref:type II toxin-antitoxin system VapC family toxin n=1 Tax=Thauera sp. TaxID=1905334 RepID=UPI002BD2B518|nr:type II toxin-antitoxin system VapC family toxin [Thauera sp.]HRP24803.1 type II toxin-antitoxin system VapC family toxin [Thauera sp.]HRP66787.1 type II toxin-antitoxin system VapC family toxin [Thauera sp.]
MLLVDTNVLIDVLEDDPQWADWSIDMLRRLSQVHRLAINPIIYAELSLTFSTVEALDEAVSGFGVDLRELPRPALFLAGKAFVAYRRTGGERKSVLADFFIGAHAAVEGWPILTRDPRKYRHYFPSVELLTP